MSSSSSEKQSAGKDALGCIGLIGYCVLTAILWNWTGSFLIAAGLAFFIFIVLFWLFYLAFVHERPIAAELPEPETVIEIEPPTLADEERRRLQTKLDDLLLARSHIAAKTPPEQLGKALRRCDEQISQLQQALAEPSSEPDPEPSPITESPATGGAFAWFKKSRTWQPSKHDLKAIDNARTFVQEYRDRRDFEEITPAEAGRFASLCFNSLVFPNEADRVALMPEALVAARKSGDRDVLHKVLSEAESDAIARKQWEECLSLSREQLTIARLGPTATQRKEGNVDPATEAYKTVMQLCCATGRYFDAFKLAFEAIPEHDPQHEILSDFFEYIRMLRRIGPYKATVFDPMLEQAKGQFITDDSSPAAKRRTSLMHHFLAEVHATWRDTPLFDLTLAEKHAGQAWFANKSEEHIETAARWWAICELQKRGSADRLVASNVPKSRLYSRIAAEGEKELTRLVTAAV